MENQLHSRHLLNVYLTFIIISYHEVIEQLNILVFSNLVYKLFFLNKNTFILNDQNALKNEKAYRNLVSITKYFKINYFKINLIIFLINNVLY